MTRWLVIGAGAAGCVIAARLSERTDHQVTVLEAGPDHGPGHAATDVGLFLDDPGRSHGGVSVVRAAGRAPEHYWQGRGLGGSSLLNGPVLAVDPADGDVEHLLPMEAPRSLGPVGAAVAAADRRAAPVVLSRRDGCRVSAADAYLRPALGRGNLTVVTDSPVAALVVEGRVVRGAVTTAGATHLADRVVVCAGALATPALLLTSGIDTPGVGEGLQDHPAIAVTLELAPGSINPAAPNITVAIDAAGTQILALNHLPGAPGFGSLVGAVMTPTSVGRIVAAARPGDPVAELDQLATPDDVERLTGLAVEVLALAAHPAVRAVAPRAFLDDRGTPAESIMGDRDAVRAWVTSAVTGYHHVAGSCRRGTVTDAWGAVVGYRGLFVGDASLFDGVPAVNPYLSVVTQAERLAARWRDAGPR